MKIRSRRLGGKTFLVNVWVRRWLFWFESFKIFMTLRFSLIFLLLIFSLTQKILRRPNNLPSTSFNLELYVWLIYWFYLTWNRSSWFGLVINEFKRSVNHRFNNCINVIEQSNLTALRREWIRSTLTCVRLRRIWAAWRSAAAFASCLATSISRLLFSQEETD